MKKITNGTILYIENLTAVSWLSGVLPYLVRGRLKDDRIYARAYFIDSSKMGSFFARITSFLVSCKLSKLDFHAREIRDESGVFVRDILQYKDIPEIQNAIAKDPEFKKILQGSALNNRLPKFLLKQIIAEDFFSNENIVKAALLIRIVAWNTEREGAAESVLFLAKRSWAGYISSYASSRNVKTVFIRTAKINAKNVLLRFFKEYTVFFVNIPFWFSGNGIKYLINRRNRNIGRSPNIAVEYYGHINLDRPEMHSDLFFLKKSGLSGEDIMLTFGLPEGPLSKDRLEELSRHNISAMALGPKKTTTFYPAPFFHYKPSLRKIDEPKITDDHIESMWFKRQISFYKILYDYWSNFFEQTNARIFMTWFKNNSTHFAIADALKAKGGIFAIYQRSFEEFPSALTAVGTDILFGFSKTGLDRERLSGSDVSYYVVTGYYGDYRFSLLRASAERIKGRLRQNGAKHILAFLDENSIGDSRWFLGHEYTRANYQFLLEKVLSEPWLGLLIKPKTHTTLRERLGSVAELLEKAEKTGRCFVFETGAIQNSYPPAAAALASDIVIHGHLFAGTASMETALAGVPTLLMDRELWPISKLYRLEKGKVIFNDWEAAWEACLEYWEKDGKVPGFGDWSSILDEMDPFRDGRAAERIGTYLKWLSDGFKAGISREDNLINAAERYAKAWGSDKIGEVKN